MAAFRNFGYTFLPERILINLAPAGMRKDGIYLDLPIMLVVLAAAKLDPVAEDLMVMGKLELSGELHPIRGTLAATVQDYKPEFEVSLYQRRMIEKQADTHEIILPLIPKRIGKKSAFTAPGGTHGSGEVANRSGKGVWRYVRINR